MTGELRAAVTVVACTCGARHGSPHIPLCRVSRVNAERAAHVASLDALTAQVRQLRAALQQVVDAIPDLCGCEQDYCLKDRATFEAVVASAHRALGGAS